jgi:hypothetical protein
VFSSCDYTLIVNSFQFSGVSREEFENSDLTIAASLFKNVFGESAGAKVLPALVAISAVGHLLGVAFTVRKYNQPQV